MLHPGARGLRSLLPFPNEEGPRHKILSKESPSFLINRCLLENCGKNAQPPWSNYWASRSVLRATRHSRGINTCCLQKLEIFKGKCIIMIIAAKHLLRTYDSADTTVITTSNNKDHVLSSRNVPGPLCELSRSLLPAAPRRRGVIVQHGKNMGSVGSEYESRRPREQSRLMEGPRLTRWALVIRVEHLLMH